MESRYAKRSYPFCSVVLEIETYANSNPFRACMPQLVEGSMEAGVRMGLLSSLVALQSNIDSQTCNRAIFS